jgi:WD40 repeat protein
MPEIIKEFQINSEPIKCISQGDIVAFLTNDQQIGYYHFLKSYLFLTKIDTKAFGQSKITSFGFNGSREILAVGSDNGSILFYDFKKSKILKTFQKASFGSVNSISSFSKSDFLVLFGSDKLFQFEISTKFLVSSIKESEIQNTPSGIYHFLCLILMINPQLKSFLR